MARFLLASNSGSSSWSTSMAASSDLQALQLQNRNLQQKLDWKQLKINQRDKHIRDLRDATPARAADLERPNGRSAGSRCRWSTCRS